MADIVIRDLDDSVVARLEARARETNQSLEDVVRSILRNAAQPSREKLWADIDAHRRAIGPIEPDATALIREDRDRR
jgi:plasmid stability protein